MQGTLITGSLVDDQGRSFMFGFRPEAGLQWLERIGRQFSHADPEWFEAETFLRAANAQSAPVPVTQAIATPAPVGHTPPRTVQRSTQATHAPEMPHDGDERVVGSTGIGAVMEDDDIAAQAAQFLNGDVQYAE